MDYKKKYLKYKNKYLNAKKLYGGDDTMNINITIDGEQQTIEINPGNIIINDLINELNIGLPQDNTSLILEHITLGEVGVDFNLSWEDNDINEGARLFIHQRKRVSFENIVEEIKKNPDINTGALEKKISKVEIDENKPWHIKNFLDLSNLQINRLPETFGDLRINKNLKLHNNQLTELPETFGNLEIGGNLDLYNNQLTQLPETFGDLRINGNLKLHNNQLTELPETFGNLEIGGNLDLYHNQLTQLPETFGDLRINGNLKLHNNQLTELPETICNLSVEGDLYLYDNFLDDNFLDEYPTKEDLPNVKGDVKTDPGQCLIRT